ncbi:hypothetical protein [Dactylosporangium sp. NPDC050588]|uniref:hypothetical protein n=1 Tax=Dactylosporangium sp. NPDC050588 TaxID=3157211 RepID=UPI0033D91FAF
MDNPWNAAGTDAVNTWHGRPDTPSAPEWNFGLDLQATRAVVAGWPGPVVYDGFEVGGRVLVGNQVCATHPAGSPVAGASGTWCRPTPPVSHRDPTQRACLIRA